MKEIHRHQTSAPNRFVYDFFCSFGFEWLSNGQTTNHRQPTAATNFKDSRKLSTKIFVIYQWLAVQGRGCVVIFELISFYLAPY